MGDLIGTAVSGELYYVRKHQFDRIRGFNAPAHEIVALTADMARINALYMIAKAGSGHIGSSFSSLDLFTHIQMVEADTGRGDVMFSSKGHDAPGLYAIMMAAGLLDEGLIHSLRRLDGLPGHPDVGTKGIVANTGSLGMGISKAKGMVIANRHAGRTASVFVVTGDGELQEGQIWESLATAAHWKMGEITVVVDHNKIQSDYSVKRTSDLGDLVAKFAAFGWHVERIDGHDTDLIGRTFARLKTITDRPKVVIADTIKGKGVSFMEGTSIDSDVDMFLFHSGAPNAVDYTRAAQELLDRVNTRADAIGAARVELERIDLPAPAGAAQETMSLFPAYTAALMEAAERHPELVSLDADLIKDMGLIPFRDRHPNRFFECGIAEQDMVSMAGGMALGGLLPVVHSFSCFLATRPNEHIYNNATEHTKIVYVGGLSGVLPAGPGHSHQSVREISAVGGVPGLVMAAPSCPEEVKPLLDWCLDTHGGPSFLRMVSIPVDREFRMDPAAEPVLGRGTELKAGRDAVLVSSGPTMLAQAVKAARLLEAEGVSLAVVNLPWLNVVDAEWLAAAVAGKRLLVTLDDHYLSGGQGEKVRSALAGAPGPHPAVLSIGLDAVPPSGQSGEVLARVGLDAAGIAAAVKKALAA